MTAKRFEINKDMNLDDKVETYELSCIVDNSNKTFYFVVDSIANVELFVKRLNELYKENQALKTDRARYEEECRLDVFKELSEENEQLKKENNKLHQKIFEMRTNIALERTEISRQTYTGKKNEKEYLDAKEFLDELEKW